MSGRPPFTRPSRTRITARPPTGCGTTGSGIAPPPVFETPQRGIRGPGGATPPGQSRHFTTHEALMMTDPLATVTGSPTVAPLTNVSLTTKALERALGRARGLPGIVVLHGPSGWGKSTAAAYAANRTRAYYVAMQSVWTRAAPSWRRWPGKWAWFRRGHHPGRPGGASLGTTGDVRPAPHHRRGRCPGRARRRRWGHQGLVRVPPSAP